MKRWLTGWGLAALLGLAACMFHPDLSRFPACDDQGACASGWTCLASEGICLPDCGERGPCPTGLDTTDAGTPDAGTDAGIPDAGPEPLILVPDGPGQGLETASFLYRFQASGGTPPYTFSSPGQLPPGLELNVKGELSGKPTAAGDFRFTLEVVDQDTMPQRASREFSLSIRPVLRMAGPGILADVPNGKPYREQLSATGGKPPYRFELVAGSTLPANIVLLPTGKVEGNPDEGGVTRAFEVRLTDSDEPPQVVTRTLQITTGSCQTLYMCVLTRAIPDGRQGSAYTYTLQTSGSTGTVTWKVAAGSTLPPGLTLSSNGILSGTPTQAMVEPYSFTLSVSDAFDTRPLKLSMQVY
ncbi:putative Ig domain-containing protein [Archangium violaceum]|uniref:Ig domain-containing protein n=1 Tax=Archangium violaceum TaxID=83451 RepID=UPI0019516695|nr:Ig domain-containing protein [Archangium violaceum]QRN96559.1 putative Ig domain-containing protein [Archangium violaceum]